MSLSLSCLKPVKLHKRFVPLIDASHFRTMRRIKPFSTVKHVFTITAVGWSPWFYLLHNEMCLIFHALRSVYDKVNLCWIRQDSVLMKLRSPEANPCFYCGNSHSKHFILLNFVYNYSLRKVSIAITTANRIQSWGNHRRANVRCFSLAWCFAIIISSNVKLQRLNLDQNNSKTAHCPKSRSFVVARSLHYSISYSKMHFKLKTSMKVKHYKCQVYIEVCADHSR